MQIIVPTPSCIARMPDFTTVAVHSHTRSLDVRREVAVRAAQVYWSQILAI